MIQGRWKYSAIQNLPLISWAIQGACVADEPVTYCPDESVMQRPPSVLSSVNDARVVDNCSSPSDGFFPSPTRLSGR